MPCREQLLEHRVDRGAEVRSIVGEQRRFRGGGSRSSSNDQAGHALVPVGVVGDRKEDAHGVGSAELENPADLRLLTATGMNAAEQLGDCGGLGSGSAHGAVNDASALGTVDCSDRGCRLSLICRSGFGLGSCLA